MVDFNQHILSLSAQIVAAHTGHNEVRTDALPDMIRNVYATLLELNPNTAMASEVVAVTLSDHKHHKHERDGHSHGQAKNEYVHPTYGQTVFNDHLICMEDGLSMKMLKRHLLTVHGITPDEYRARWGLPPDYPMVASQYAKLRSNLALQSGLGLKPEDRPAKGRKGRKG